MLVSAWAEIQRTQSGARVFIDLLAIAQNGSNQPIYDVMIFWLLDDKNIYQTTTNLIPPNSPYRWEIPTEVFKGAPEINLENGMSAKVALSIIKRSRIQITFNDTENKKWTRRHDGRLIQIDEV